MSIKHYLLCTDICYS